MATTRLTRSITGSNATKATLSFWIKRSEIGGGAYVVFTNRIDASNDTLVRFTGDKLDFKDYQSGSNAARLETTQFFRDTGAWYHLVISIDTTLATADDRQKMYVNGTQITSFASRTNYAQNTVLNINKTGTMEIGANNSADYFNGLMSYFACVDGTAYTPTSFGEVNAASGIWKINTAPSVTYGTNGFFLKMDTSSPGSDTSGNDNTFTAAGTPTLTQDNASSNFCTLTPLIRMSASLTNGNTSINDTDSAWHGGGSTMGVSSGKWYWEYELTRIGNYSQDGVMGGLAGNGYNDIYATYVGSKTAGVALNTGEGSIYSADSSTAWFGSANSQGQIIGVALDLDNNKIYYSQNGVFGNSSNPASNTNGYALSATVIANKPLLPCFSIYNCNISYNFGNGFFKTTAVTSSNADAAGHGLFEYAVPTGFFTLNTKNLNTYGG